MAKVNSLLFTALKTGDEKLSKMTNLVEMSSNGNLSSFSGSFPRQRRSMQKKKKSSKRFSNNIKTKLKRSTTILSSFDSITSEVKAINNQAIILHGERIKKAQEILKNYRDGAFTAWLDRHLWQPTNALQLSCNIMNSIQPARTLASKTR